MSPDCVQAVLGEVEPALPGSCERCHTKREVRVSRPTVYAVIASCPNENCPLFGTRIVVGDGAERLSVTPRILSRRKRAERYVRRNARRRAAAWQRTWRRGT